MVIKKPIPNFTISEIATFFSRVNKTPTCWLWTSYGNEGGYGIFRKFIAHRVSYSLYKGQPPIDMDVDHLCKNRLYVNPDHLEAVTHQENIKRGNLLNDISATNKIKTHCKHGHELTSDNIYRYQRRGRNPERQCRTCVNDRAIARYYSTKAVA